MADEQIQHEPFDVFYSRSPSFKTVHGDGVLGAASPRGLVRMSVYTERSNLPQKSTLTIKDQGKVSEELTVVDKGVEREFQVEVSFDLPTAVSVGYWLINQSNIARKQMNMPDEAWDQLNKAAGQ